MHRLLGLLVLVAINPVAGAHDSVNDMRRWAIVGLNVVNVESGEIEPDQAITIEHGVVDSVVAVTAFDPESVDLVVKFDGQYAIPGLWDSHVHMRGGPELIAANQHWLHQYLGFGITTVRDAGGDLPNSVMHWKAQIEQGRIKGPRIYSALRKIDGVHDSQPGSIPVGSEDDVDAAMDYLVLAGADFAKIYDMSLPRDLFLYSVREAKARSLRVSAHVPPWVPFEQLINDGLGSVEHAIYLAKAADPDDRRFSISLTPEDLAEYVTYYKTIADIGERADPERLQESFRLMVSHGTAVVATLTIEQLILAYMDGLAPENPRRAATPKEILETHDETLELYSMQDDDYAAIQRRIVHRTEALVKSAADAGVTILAGSDTGVNNPLLYPGDSLHAELEALVAVGIPPLEALRSATINPARWLGVYPTFGSISAGAAADIVILNSNPLEDIANTRSLAAVIQQGVYFDSEELNELKKPVPGFLTMR
jgi:imidazolonepropionase-like amidohydrolase